MSKKNAQVALEFIIITSLVAVTFVIATSTLFIFINDSTQKRQEESLKHVGDVLFNEVTMARSVQDNYKRYFSLPKNIDGLEYDMKILDYFPPYSNNSEVIFFLPNSNENAYKKVLVLPNTHLFSLSKECNIITKKNKTIKISKTDVEKCQG